MPPVTAWPFRAVADWCVPPGALEWGDLDGYLPAAPAGYRWVHRPALTLVARADAVGERWPTGQWVLRPCGSNRRARRLRRSHVV
jgi:hypothetical protein